MEKIKYRKEVKIRVGYVLVGRRLGYLQRKRNEYNRLENLTYTAENYLERDEDRLRKGLSERSRYFVRRSTRRRTTTTCMVYRNRGPGRFQHEYRKRKAYLIVRNRLFRIGSRKWYESEVDVTREDRNRNYRFVLVLCRRRNRIREKTKETKKVTYKQYNRIDVRRRYIWLNLIRSRVTREKRRERSNRRSRMRLRGGYRICIERTILRLYGKKGRRREEEKKRENDESVRKRL